MKPKTYTVNQLAKMAGVSVRTLHHYDEIGLLKPAYTGANRYRHYGQEELLRLQQILIHRAMDIPFVEIAAILDARGFDRLAALEKQRERLQEQAERYARIVRTIDRTIARLKGESEMKDDDLYTGVVAPEKQAQYEAWLVERCGPNTPARIEASRRKAVNTTSAELAASMAELKAVEQGLADAMRRGVAAEDVTLDPWIDRHHTWVAAAWGAECPPAAYAGLADVYDHPDFRARYESIEPGFSDYLISAIRSWAQRQG